jgi:hypothetical protein
VVPVSVVLLYHVRGASGYRMVPMGYDGDVNSWAAGSVGSPSSNFHLTDLHSGLSCCVRALAQQFNEGIHQGPMARM